MARTNIDLDSSLVARAMRLTGARTKKAVVHLALRRLVHKEEVYAGLRRLKGRLVWEGNLARSRRARS